MLFVAAEFSVEEKRKHYFCSDLHILYASKDNSSLQPRQAKVLDAHDMKGGCEEDGAGLYSVVSNAKTRGKVHKLEYKRFLITRKRFCAIQVAQKGCGFSSLEITRTWAWAL